ncbi:MAG TPA: 4-hydroxy-tetrahydrodipicolinate reductase, partial [Flavitalea sp.]|nr:4-hydroxy-tetrahydrodipicolinate reductase [Flavitalea sp.]
MRLALIGYGKMGKAIEQIALERKHEVVLRVSIENVEDNTVKNIKKADVAIEFTGPDSAFENVSKCMEAGIPVVCGSTGWLQHFDEAVQLCKKNQGALIYASNFSIGVNLFFALNTKLAEMMNNYPEYDPLIHEIHHTQKKDAPSGTAITLAEQILQKHKQKESWVNAQVSDSKKLSVTSERTDPAPGTHIVTYHSAVDDIEIRHTAHNRTGFATGAVLAAEFLQNKKGIFSMKDVLGL